MIEADKAELKEAVAVLRKGGIISFRSDVDTYLACDVSNSAAVERIFQDATTSFCLLIADLETRLNYYLKEFPEQASVLFEYAEKPITIFFEELKNLPDVILNVKRVGFRITKDPLTSALGAGIRRPLLCIPLKASTVAADYNLSTSTAQFAAGDEKRMEFRAGGIIRFIEGI